jgi:hypothetical protein
MDMQQKGYSVGMLPGEALGNSEDLLVDEMEDNLLETEFNFLATDED